jgi:hypothetical protein
MFINELNVLEFPCKKPHHYLFRTVRPPLRLRKAIFVVSSHGQTNQFEVTTTALNEVIQKMDKKRATKFSGSFSIWLLNLGSNQGPTD